MAETLLQIEAEATVTTIAFHPEDSTLLAYGTIHGEIYIRELLPGEPVDAEASFDSDDYDWDNRSYPRAVLRASTKCHSGAVRSIEWHTANTLSPRAGESREDSGEKEAGETPGQPEGGADNGDSSIAPDTPAISYLLTSGADGTVAVVRVSGESGCGITLVEQKRKVMELTRSGMNPIAENGSVDVQTYPILKLTDDIRFVVTVLSICKLSDHAIKTAKIFNIPINLKPQRKERKNKAYEARLASEGLDTHHDGEAQEPLSYTAFLFVGDDNGDIRIYSFATGETDRLTALGRRTPFTQVQTLTDAGDFISGIVYGPTRHQVFATAGDGTVYIYQYSPTKKLFVLVDNSSPEQEDYQCISTNFGRESHILVGSGSGHVAVYNPRDIALRTTLIKVRSRSVEEIVFLGQGLFVCGCGNGSIKLIDCSPPRLLGTLSQPFRGAISALAVAPDVSVAGCAAYTNMICILDISWISDQSRALTDESEDSGTPETSEASDGSGRPGEQGSERKSANASPHHASDPTEGGDPSSSLDSMAHVAEPGSLPFPSASSSSTESDSESTLSDALNAVLERKELEQAVLQAKAQNSNPGVQNNSDGSDGSEDSIDVFSTKKEPENPLPIPAEKSVQRVQLGNKIVEVKELRTGITRVGEHMKVIAPGCVDADSSFDEFFTPAKRKVQKPRKKQEGLLKGTREAKRRSFFSDV